MSTNVTAYKRIIDKNGVPMIDGTAVKVVELISSYLAYGWSPEELSSAITKGLRLRGVDVITAFQDRVEYLPL